MEVKPSNRDTFPSSRWGSVAKPQPARIACPFPPFYTTRFPPSTVEDHAASMLAVIWKESILCS